MPIYKGTQRITSVAKGTQTVNNVYNGTVPVFSSVQYPYRVNIVGDGIVNTYSSAGINYELPAAYFCVNNTSNTGKTWYGIIMNETAWSVMEVVTNHQTTNQMLKTGWYAFISLWIGYDVINTNFSNFTIANTFYALNAKEWDDNTMSPVDPTNTHCWKFISNGNYFDINYVTLTAADFTAINSIIASGAQIQEIHLQPLGREWSTTLQVDMAWLVVSNNITFNQIYSDMVIEYLTNNGSRVTSTTLQSQTNNFNFSVYSIFITANNEVTRLGWTWSADTSNLKLLQISSYVAPQYNIPGTLTTELVPLGGNEEDN